MQNRHGPATVTGSKSRVCHCDGDNCRGKVWRRYEPEVRRTAYTTITGDLRAMGRGLCGAVCSWFIAVSLLINGGKWISHVVSAPVSSEVDYMRNPFFNLPEFINKICE